MSLAALRELRRLQPQARLTLLARKWVAPIFNGQGLADRVVTLENRSLGVRGVFRVGRRLRGFDTAVLFQNAFEAALLALTARIPNRIGYTTDGRRLLLTQGVRPRIKDLGRHQTYYYLDLLFQAGVSPIDYLEDSSFRPDIRITPSRAQLESADSLLGEAGADSGRPLVGLNPGAAFGSAKRWFPERYAEVADRLIREMDGRGRAPGLQCGDADCGPGPGADEADSPVPGGTDLALRPHRGAGPVPAVSGKRFGSHAPVGGAGSAAGGGIRIHGRSGHRTLEPRTPPSSTNMWSAVPACSGSAPSICAASIAFTPGRSTGRPEGC